jgi:hypothetical protein
MDTQKQFIKVILEIIKEMAMERCLGKEALNFSKDNG